MDVSFALDMFSISLNPQKWSQRDEETCPRSPGSWQHWASNPRPCASHLAVCTVGWDLRLNFLASDHWMVEDDDGNRVERMEFYEFLDK